MGSHWGALVGASLFGAMLVCSCGDSSKGGSGGGGGSGNTGAGIGEPCPNGTSDCQPGFGCDGDDPGGGQCYKPCKPHQDSDCGDTSKYVCNVEGHCYIKCKTDDDCPRHAQGYVCKDDSPPRGVKFCDVPD